MLGNYRLHDQGSTFPGDRKSMRLSTTNLERQKGGEKLYKRCGVAQPPLCTFRCAPCGLLLPGWTSPSLDSHLAASFNQLEEEGEKLDLEWQLVLPAMNVNGKLSE